MQREKCYEIFVDSKIYFYFCILFHSWERGANENTKDFIKQKHPKGTCFSEIIK